MAMTISQPIFTEEEYAEERLYKEIFYEEYKRLHETEIRCKIRHQLELMKK